MTRLAARLTRCTRGASVIEFALLAPVFFAMLFGIIELSRAYWIRQTINSVAYSTARCMSVDSQCASASQQKTYAVNLATRFGVTIASSNVTPTGNTMCKGNANSNSITISRSFNSPLNGLVPSLPATLTAEACFPALA